MAHRDDEDVTEAAAMVRRLLMHNEDTAIQGALAELLIVDDTCPHCREPVTLGAFVPMLTCAALAGVARDLLARLWPDEDDPARMEWIARCADAVTG